ncbi:TPA: colicin immunity domain-containing protein, partial [Salmonella enterica subsp. diarizonae serovar 50:k:z35]
KKMVLSQISANDFEIEFFKLWREEAKSGLLANDNKEIGECLYAIFDLAERYTSDPDRSDIEIDEETLKKGAKLELEKFKFI